MNQFLYTTQNEQDRVILVYKNGKHSNSKPLQITLHLKLTFYDIKEILQQKMRMHGIRNLRLFTAEGVEIFEEDLQFIKSHATLFASRGEDFDSASSFSEYRKIKVIGEGGFGKVILGEHRATKEKVAIKIVNTAMIGNAQDIDMVFREAEMLKSLHHKNIVNILRCYTLPNMQVVFIMEYLEGGELLDYVTQKGRLSEFEAREFFQQIVDAIAYCHKEKLIHRDLKLENIMLLNKTSKTIKIVDFGIAGVSSNFNIDKINVGSLKYMAPEVLSGKIDKVGPSLDVWALGVILYVLVCGEMPFDGQEPQDVVANICAGRFVFPEDLVSTQALSADFIQLIYSIFITDPHKRATLKMIQENSWMLDENLSSRENGPNAKKKTQILKVSTKLGKDRTGLKVQYSSGLKREGTSQQLQNQMQIQQAQIQAQIQAQQQQQQQQQLQQQQQQQQQKQQQGFGNGSNSSLSKKNSLPRIQHQNSELQQQQQQKTEIHQIQEEDNEDLRQSSQYSSGNNDKGAFKKVRSSIGKINEASMNSLQTNAKSNNIILNNNNSSNKSKFSSSPNHNNNNQAEGNSSVLQKQQQQQQAREDGKFDVKVIKRNNNFVDKLAKEAGQQQLNKNNTNNNNNSNQQRQGSPNRILNQSYANKNNSSSYSPHRNQQQQGDFNKISLPSLNNKLDNSVVGSSHPNQLPAKPHLPITQQQQQQFSQNSSDLQKKSAFSAQKKVRSLSPKNGSSAVGKNKQNSYL